VVGVVVGVKETEKGKKRGGKFQVCGGSLSSERGGVLLLVVSSLQRRVCVNVCGKKRGAQINNLNSRPLDIRNNSPFSSLKL
jgi:hypothetical protein